MEWQVVLVVGVGRDIENIEDEGLLEVTLLDDRHGAHHCRAGVGVRLGCTHDPDIRPRIVEEVEVRMMLTTNFVLAPEV